MGSGKATYSRSPPRGTSTKRAALDGMAGRVDLATKGATGVGVGGGGPGPGGAAAPTRGDGRLGLGRVAGDLRPALGAPVAPRPLLGPGRPREVGEDHASHGPGSADHDDPHGVSVLVRSARADGPRVQTGER